VNQTLMSTVFVDFEYCGQQWTNPSRFKPISVGMISEDGQRNLYLELQGWDKQDCDPWVVQHVLPHLAGQAWPIGMAKLLIADWLSVESAAVGQIHLSADSKVDIALLANILGPDHPRYAWENVGYVYDLSVSLRAMDQFFLSARQHHALDDARGLRLGWLACTADKR